MCWLQVREEPVFTRTSPRLTETLSPCLGGPLSEAEISNAVSTTISVKVAFGSHFWQIEKPAGRRRMLSGRICKAFIHEKMWTHLTEQCKATLMTEAARAGYTWKFLYVVVMFNCTLNLAARRATIHGMGKRCNFRRWETGYKPRGVDHFTSRWCPQEADHEEQCQQHSWGKIMFCFIAGTNILLMDG